MKLRSEPRQSARRARATALLSTALAVAMLVAACGGSDGADSDGGADSVPGEQAAADEAGDSSGMRFPEIVGAEATPGGDGTFSFAVTVSSPYDSPERYADGWRILTPDGEVLGERPLLHDHANEQPFTRTLEGVEVRAGVEEVVVEGRDLENGWGGKTATIALQR